ncbi:MAG: VOC family protein [Bacteroidota bacterium]
MKIDHLGIWVSDLEAMRRFYVKYFGMISGDKYINEQKGFSSYFLSFENSNIRLEIMHKNAMTDNDLSRGIKMGLAHFAISVGSESAVNDLTESLRNNYYAIASEPRRTGDGYYESVILDPEGNFVEICV